MTENIVREASTIQCTYQWIINIHKFPAAGESLESPVFSTTYFGKSYKWKLVLYPNGESENDRNWMSILVYNCGKTKNTFNFRVKFADVNDFSLSDWSVFKADILPRNIARFQKFATTDCLLTYDKIIVSFDITFDKNNEEVKRNNETKKQQSDDGMKQLLGEYESLINQKDFSDVSFIVEEKTIHAHKCILVKSSPVFTAMFQHKMKEKLENAVEVKDIRYEVFIEMLNYMYAGKINGIEKIADELLAAADKYALDRLKKVCEQSLFENLSVDNAIASLKLADQYRLDKLKLEAIDFIVSRVDDFINMPEFKLLTHMPEVIFEVCQAMAKNLN